MKDNLIEETIELLQEVRLECDDTESCVVDSIDQAIENLTQLNGSGKLDADKAVEALSAIGKVFSAFPAIQKILEGLGLL